MTVHRWQDLSWTELAALDIERAVAVLPLGAVEQHGPHLPLSVDGTINAAVLDRALAALPGTVTALALPQQPVGVSPEHAEFPGTLSLSPETMLALLRELGASVAATSVRRLVLLNSHGGQPAALDMAAQALRRHHGMLAVPVNAFRLWHREDHLPAEKAAYDVHAGAVETAIMMHLAPGSVRDAELRDFASGAAGLRNALEAAAPGAGARAAWQAGDLNPAGAAGDATLANAEMGARIVDQAAAALARIIEELAAAEPPPRGRDA